PFEGLKGVPGWDAPEPSDPPETRAADPAPAAPVNSAPTAAAEPAPKPAVASSLLAGETELAARKGSWRYDGADEAVAAPEAGAGKSAGEAPALYALADPSQADDLKRINGVGPKLEEKLNAVGVHHFHQIAAWTPAHVAWMDDKLSFKGRIERDDWIGQAAALAAEGKE
ncbi:NADH-quinone oxidoreductase subunit E, partial [Cribrihabitans sp. XS_ASV171]